MSARLRYSFGDEINVGHTMSSRMKKTPSASVLPSAQLQKESSTNQTSLKEMQLYELEIVASMTWYYSI